MENLRSELTKKLEVIIQQEGYSKTKEYNSAMKELITEDMRLFSIGKRYLKSEDKIVNFPAAKTVMKLLYRHKIKAETISESLAQLYDILPEKERNTLLKKLLVGTTIKHVEEKCMLIINVLRQQMPGASTEKIIFVNSLSLHILLDFGIY